jgi:hypothetical protein
MKGTSNTLLIICLSILGAGGLALTPKNNYPASEQATRDHVQRIYTAEIGIRERTGNNDGLRVEEYLRYVKLKKGDPWCAAFVCWALGKAGVENPRSGWSPDLFPRQKIVWERTRMTKIQAELQRSRNADFPRHGDVFGIWFADRQRIAHVGFVDKWTDDWLITVEGNTNEAGSREGDGVYRKRRLIRSIWQVARWVRREG